MIYMIIIGQILKMIGPAMARMGASSCSACVIWKDFHLPVARGTGVKRGLALNVLASIGRCTLGDAMGALE